MVAAKWAKLKVGNPNLIPPVGGIGTTETKTRDEAAKRRIPVTQPAFHGCGEVGEVEGREASGNLTNWWS
jgi:hypothetical protein